MIITCLNYNDDDDLNIMRTRTNYDNDLGVITMLPCMIII